MRNSWRLLGIGLALLTVMAAAGASTLQAPARAQEESQHVMSVTKFKVPAGELANFIELTRQANQIHDDVGSVAEVRMWTEILAGDAFGTVIHTKEYPSFEAMAADYSLVHPTDEWQAFLEEFNASGVEVISNTLQWEIVP